MQSVKWSHYTKWEDSFTLLSDKYSTQRKGSIMKKIAAIASVFLSMSLSVPALAQSSTKFSLVQNETSGPTCVRLFIGSQVVDLTTRNQSITIGLSSGQLYTVSRFPTATCGGAATWTRQVTYASLPSAPQRAFAARDAGLVIIAN